MSWYPSHMPTLAQQALRLRAAQPRSSIRFDHRGNRMVWHGRLQPTAASDTYLTRIIYSRRRANPSVFIVSPGLNKRNCEPIPHRYDNGSLCLWQPAHQEWKPTYWIVDTVLGWASLWLFFYELWHACGEWLGGGEHPSASSMRSGATQLRLTT